MNVAINTHFDSDEDFLVNVRNYGADSPIGRRYSMIQINTDEVRIFVSPTQLAHFSEVLNKAVAEQQASEAA